MYNKYDELQNALNAGVFFNYVYGYPSKKTYYSLNEENVINHWIKSKVEKMDLYIHIPFCVNKCYFCNLCSTAQCTSSDIEDYVNVIIESLEAYGKKLKDVKLHSIYFGGGTPTLLSEKQFSIIFDVINKYFIYESNDIEICVEGCPKSISTELTKLITLKTLGVNRISMGVQSFLDKELEEFGRSHRNEDTYRAIDVIRKTQIKDLNLDLIYGLKNQSMEQWEYNLCKLMEFSPETATLYPLNIRKDTLLFEGKEGSINYKKMYDMYDYTCTFMHNHGYSHDTYVLFSKGDSNFGYKQQHSEFHCNPMLGVGLAARSYIKDIQYSSLDTSICTKTTVREFIDRRHRNPLEAEIGVYLDINMQKRRYVILGLLDFLNGVNVDEYCSLFGEKLEKTFLGELDWMKRNNMLVFDESNIKLSNYGRRVSNLLPELLGK